MPTGSLQNSGRSEELESLVKVEDESLQSDTQIPWEQIESYQSSSLQRFTFDQTGVYHDAALKEGP